MCYFIPGMPIVCDGKKYTVSSEKGKLLNLRFKLQESSQDGSLS